MQGKYFTNRPSQFLAKVLLNIQCSQCHLLLARALWVSTVVYMGALSQDAPHIWAATASRVLLALTINLQHILSIYSALGQQLGGHCHHLGTSTPVYLFGKHFVLLSLAFGDLDS